jgi:putative inorganic carbon (HCO3(-)) transporter
MKSFWVPGRIGPSGPPPARASGIGMGPVLAGGLVAGVVAVAVIILGQEGSIRLVWAILCGFVMLIGLALAGNLRASSLYIILMIAPLATRLSFFRYPHMGGAGGLLIDAIDPFMLLLLYFQLRDRVAAHREFRFPLALKFWVAMIVLGIGTVIFGYLRVVAMNEVFRMAKLLLLALLIVNEVTRRPQFRNVIVALMLGVILQSTVAILEFSLGRQLGLEFLGESSDEDIQDLSVGTLLTGEFAYRPGALLGHSNLLAAYLAMYMPMAIALLLANVSPILKALLAVALLVGQPALVLTLSRGGWIEFSIAFVLVILFGAIHPLSRRKFMLARVVIIAITITIATAASPQIMERVFGADPNSVKGRLEWLETAKAMVIANPVFGVGLNCYVYMQLPYGKHKTPQEMTQQYGDIWPAVHNSWMLAWSEQGTVGFAFWVMFHILVLREAIRSLRIRDPMMHALNAGLLAGFIAIMFDGLTSFYVRTEGPGRTFWILVGLILAIGYWRRANEESDPPLPASLALPDPAAPPDGADSTRGRWLPARPSALR